MEGNPKMWMRYLQGRCGSKAIALSITFVLGGCAISPYPVDKQEIADVVQRDRDAARAGMPALTAPLSLDEAIARALKFNLDHRTRILEQALAIGQLDASRFDMLPRLVANAGYTDRDEENIRRATDSVTGEASLANPYISSERRHTTSDMTFSWNILDFGASYYAGKQQADRVLIASERRRKSMHHLIQNVRTAFWRAIAAEKLQADIAVTIQEAETALANSQRVEAERIKEPIEALRYQRALLENLRLLENVSRELTSARVELAGLVGLTPSTQYTLLEPTEDQSKLTPLNTPVEQLEEMALTNNADLREQFYNVRIAAHETRRALLKLLPGLSFDYGYNHDSDDYLINNNWNEASMRVSFNLFNVFSAPSQLKSAKAEKTLAENRRMALQMTVLTQLHLARQQYSDALRHYQRADAIAQVDTRWMELTRNRQESQIDSQLDRVSVGVSAILSRLRRFEAIAKAQEAAGRMQATLGITPNIGSVDELTLPDLTRTMHELLKSGVLAEQMAPVPQM